MSCTVLYRQWKWTPFRRKREWTGECRCKHIKKRSRLRLCGNQRLIYKEIVASLMLTICQCFPCVSPFLHLIASPNSRTVCCVADQLCSVLRRQLSHPVFPFSFYTSKSQLLCNSFTPRIKLAGRKVGAFLIYLFFLLACQIPFQMPSIGVFLESIPTAATKFLC